MIVVTAVLIIGLFVVLAAAVVLGVAFVGAFVWALVQDRRESAVAERWSRRVARPVPAPRRQHSAA
ncbi:MAG: hypothetical protein C0418_01055 [Coriobacteriaceae bacterium]|nr:hypothetical protein [Coriobacteriaceae bacterium]